MQTMIVMGFVCACAAGCTVSTSGPAPAPVADGTLDLTWTINRTDDPNQCHQAVAVTLDLTITDPNGGTFETQSAPCDAFVLDVALPPGDYGAYARLVDGAGNPRTTTISLVPFQISPNTSYTIPIDFPASSFE